MGWQIYTNFPWQQCTIGTYFTNWGNMSTSHKFCSVLWLEDYSSGFFYVYLFLAWSELSDISVMALLYIFVGTLQNGFLLQAGHCLFLLNTTKTSLRVLLTSTEVNSSLKQSIFHDIVVSLNSIAKGVRCKLIFWCCYVSMSMFVIVLSIHKCRY